MPKDPTYFQKVASQENGKKGGRPKRHRAVAPSVLKLYFDTKDERDRVVEMGGSRLIKQLLNMHGADVFLTNRKSAKQIKHYDRIDPAVLLELSKIGNNLNQIARWVNIYKDESDCYTVTHELKKIEQALLAVLPKSVHESSENAH
jgi:hypothetical protein